MKTMITHFNKLVIRSLGLLLIAGSIFSCTYDYFEDENNFRLQVPQIAEGSADPIERLYVAIHDVNGKHMYTREMETPFDYTDQYIKDGILRFKLPEGDYIVTCFAEYSPNSISEGRPFGESQQWKTKCKKDNWLVDYGDDAYESRNTNPRMLQLAAHAYMFGDPNGTLPVVADIDPDQSFKGKVDIEFHALPANVTRIDVLYKGLGTRFQFDGKFDRNSVDDTILASYDIQVSGNIIALPTDIINASVGTVFSHNVSNCGTVVTEEPIELDIRMFAGDMPVGETTFTNAMFQQLTNDKKPVDSNGQPLQKLVLEPQERIKFTFKGLTIWEISLVGWGNTDIGDVTPM